jgi:hypothetical protein
VPASNAGGKLAKAEWRPSTANAAFEHEIVAIAVAPRDHDSMVAGAATPGDLFRIRTVPRCLSSRPLPHATAAGGTVPPAAFLCPSYADKKSGSAYEYCSGPSAFTTGVTCYLGVRGTANDYVAAKRGVFGMQSVNSVTQSATTKIKDILDGTSKTFMFGEFRPDSQIAVGQSSSLDPDSRVTRQLHHEAA